MTFLHWCYEAVNRDGTIEFQIHEVAGDLDESYYTVRKWWAAVKGGPWFSEVVDRGKRGFRIRMADDWLEWRRAIKSPSSNGQVPDPVLEDERVTIEPSSNAGQVPNDVPEGSVKLRSSAGEVPSTVLEEVCIKVLMSDQESESTRESENHDNAVGSHSLKNGTGPKPKQRDALATALLEACQVNPNLVDVLPRHFRDQLNTVYQRLKGIEATPEDIKKRIEYWYEHDWRQRNEGGRPPTPEELMSIWEQAVTSKPVRPKANAPPTDNRPALQPYQAQHARTDPAKFRAAAEEVARKKANNGDTS